VHELIQDYGLTTALAYTMTSQIYFNRPRYGWRLLAKAWHSIKMSRRDERLRRIHHLIHNRRAGLAPPNQIGGVNSTLQNLSHLYIFI